MILEVATVRVQAGKEAEFEAAIATAYRLLKETEGYCSHTLRRCLEQSDRYLLTIEWQTLEAHTVNFRQSDNFVTWRSIIGHFFAAPPEVLHYEIVHQS
ncbi:antibiotic biosynthesis monooxygenase [Synechococcus sp. PCC 7336]|uniref:antibiotic biosynthesis monooxygenase family protein n=1 Tax=Synechococcus sp. PCC 7336 TaxID=195250 RepID=UPI00034C492B|nr:antibiotic biosynthesis monooxygenase [Synechococcus sp. PCC 7336]